MTPLETVLGVYTLPPDIVPRPLQVDAINDLGLSLTQGHWHDMGVGKTFIATMIALYYKVAAGHKTFVIMPPLLIPQWGRWLRSLKPGLTVVEYRGTPKERNAMNLDADFVLVGVQIFKRDFERINNYAHMLDYSVIVDEATMCGNVETDNHKRVYQFALGRVCLMLTGTPINKPLDGYAMIKFVAPGTYKSFMHFKNLHVAEWDFYKNPVAYQNLDMLQKNLMLNSKRILFEDIYKDTEEPLFVPTTYTLEPEHYKLYKELAENQLLVMEDGGKIDATSANRLTHALGQIIVNWAHFSENFKNVSNAIGLIEQKLDELGDGKLVVFANYRLTVSHLRQHLDKYGVVTINSEVSEKQKDANVQRFVSDPRCRVIVIQFVSGGKGLDGLQHVSNTAFFVEPCQQPRDFHQCVGRLKRMGQRRRVVVHMGIAEGTTQVRGFANLISNDTLVNRVIRNATDLRDAVYGRTSSSVVDTFTA